jgi:hypothetical protein
MKKEEIPKLEEAKVAKTKLHKLQRKLKSGIFKVLFWGIKYKSLTFWKMGVLILIQLMQFHGLLQHDRVKKHKTLQNLKKPKKPKRR